MFFFTDEVIIVVVFYATTELKNMDRDWSAHYQKCGLNNFFLVNRVTKTSFVGVGLDRKKIGQNIGSTHDQNCGLRHFFLGLPGR